MKNTAATAALVLAIAALFVNTMLLTSTAALVFGIVGLVKASGLNSRGLGPVGRARSIWALVLVPFAAIFTAFFKLFMF